MRIILLAIVLSFSVLTIPVYANVQKQPVLNAPATDQFTNKQINLNTANAQDLAGSFKGIGQKKAQAIVNYRETHERFKSVADLAQVRGLGRAFVDRNLAQLERVFSVG